MENYFKKYRDGIIGLKTLIPTPDGCELPIVYADWTASGRNYGPIEHRIQQEFMPYVANTHTETSSTGMAMTYAYHRAQNLIKQHVNASGDDVIITAGAGMTRLVNKFQRILNLKSREEKTDIEYRPVVFITHMEHHSNHTSWLETNVTLEIIPPTSDGLVDLHGFRELLKKYENRKTKIASVTACSNVTGIETPYHDIAKIIHCAGGYCFVDFACSAPYVDIDMHPDDPEEALDAIMFSPHKFLGGPGSAGVLVFNKKLYHNAVPDNPGGGTVDWTNPWGEHRYLQDIEQREDGGTPAFLQTIKTALAIKLKEEMGTEQIRKREGEMINRLWDKVAHLENVHILASQHRERLAIFSFYITDLHYNLAVRLLNDKFGVQSRGGCSCAGTYGHYLLNVDPDQSKKITDEINQGVYVHKPGWIRISMHPTMTDKEVDHLAESISSLARHHREWSKKYAFDDTYCNLNHVSQVLDEEIRAKMDDAFKGALAVEEVNELL